MIDILNKINALLKGRKTYIGAAILAGISFAYAMGYIDTPTFEKARTVIFAWIAMGLRDAIK